MNSIISSNPGVIAQSAQATPAPEMTESPSSQSLSSSQAPVRKLPYQATHQVELMHLEAETEALLQHLQALKQRRQTVQSVPQSSGQPAPALAIR